MKELTVTMFGGFEVSYGETAVIPRDARNSKVVQLFQYLLCRRGSMIPQGELIEVLLGEADCANPLAVLKNIVYRLRKLLGERGVPRECILHAKSSYSFSGEMPCRIDIEEYEEAVRQLKDGGQAAGDRLALCFRAMDLYREGFLPHSSGEPWVMGAFVRYEGMYCDLFRTAQPLVREQEAYDAFLARLKKATGLYPYEEDLSLMYIDCLYETKRVQEALEAYDAAANLMLDDLGLKPSQRMRALRSKITGGMQEVVPSVLEVRSKIAEAGASGALFCNLEVFTNIYRFVVRHMERSGQSVFLMLCTLSELDGTPLTSGGQTKKTVEQFLAAASASLRKSDVYTRYSPSQFVLMLMEIKQENCGIVADRLRYFFYRNSRMNRTRLTCKSISASDMDIMMEDSSAGKW